MERINKTKVAAVETISMQGISFYQLIGCELMISSRTNNAVS